MVEKEIQKKAGKEKVMTVVEESNFNWLLALLK